MPQNIFVGKISTYSSTHGDTTRIYEEDKLVRVVVGSISLAEAACCLQAGHYRQTYIILHWS